MISLQEHTLSKLEGEHRALKLLAERLLLIITSAGKEGSVRCQQFVSGIASASVRQRNRERLDMTLFQQRQQRIKELRRQNSLLRRTIKERLSMMKSTAKEGSARCQINLGLLYELGDLAAITANVKAVEANEREAYRWYRAAAEQGYAEGQKYLGLFLIHGGKEIKKNPSEGVKWLKLAAEQGLADGQFFLAQAYNKGWGVSANPMEAARWFQRAADQGHSFALGFLAFCYERGKGVEQNYQKAVKLYERAIQKGHSDSSYDLAEMYRKGLGLERDYGKALELYRQASDHRLSGVKGEARIRIGEMYEQGLGVNRDLTLAREWFQRALKEHHSVEIANKAREALQRLHGANDSQ